MPITCQVHFEPLTKEAFHQLDYLVMKHVFDCHNELGRLCDEDIYQADVALRLNRAGLAPVRREVPVLVTWKTFHKRYYLDLVVWDGALYELKTRPNLEGEHQAQTLNYMLLLGLREGKLVNFRPPSVQWRFVSTGLTPAMRMEFEFREDRFREVSPACATMRTVLGEVLSDWGAYLELALYQEAVTWFLGGGPKLLKQVPLTRDGVLLGNQSLPMLAPDVAFRMTAVTEKPDCIEAHLRRFLAITPLRALQWINFNHAKIDLVTLLR
jgi:GxxExxY protein